jgi:hypothetical protein
MQSLFIFLLGFTSRMAILYLYFFTDYLSQFSAYLLPTAAGLLLAPLTTLFCAYLLSSNDILSWYSGVFLFFCLLFDLFLDKRFIKEALRE